jgi:hypothetical protein
MALSGTGTSRPHFNRDLGLRTINMIGENFQAGYILCHGRRVDFTPRYDMSLLRPSRSPEREEAIVSASVFPSARNPSPDHRNGERP